MSNLANKPAAIINLREHFAGQCMAALITDQDIVDYKWAARHAIASADALITELQIAEVAEQYEEDKP